ncbi:putative protein kinase RLK-Pelle-SD-2b family [Helianthus annuus]|nr:putative protein kinase RLK-Pelle-SD-2b family [Helianthus annuus]
MMREPWICYCSALFLILNCHSTTAQQRTEPPFDYPLANLSTTWVNTQSFRNNISFTDGSMVRPILLRGSFGPKFACGFYCNGTCTSYLFTVFIAQTNSGGQITQPSSGFPQVVWSANRDHPVGYGAVFEGTLEDDSKIAVKCLEGLGQVNKSFLAEVQTIGSIHHVNLVRLRGFSAWKSQRFLVYEFMSNGSLDRWIYHGVREHVLEWKCRKKIILDVAKGLAYLHEECRQKIIHLDIKPQNILLDSDFNAKVSDFGLSKLIDRNQSQVMTTMRGTPGYLAPEWLSSVITEKVDVYSFGIVLLEILCGRKNFDRSQPEESWLLLSVFQKCWEQGMLLDMVDKYSEDMETHSSEVVEMMKVASWCLQYDYTKRPSMSTVVKVLEGVMEVESRLDYNFTDPRMQNTAVEEEKDMTPLMASVLSGPR